MLDDPVMFLRGAGQEAGDIDEGDDRDVERIAEPHEPRGLLDALMSSTPASTIGWLATTPTVRAFDPAEPDDDIAGVVRLDFEEIALVQHLARSPRACHRAGWRWPGSACRGCPRAGPTGRLVGRSGTPSRLLTAAGNRRNRARPAALRYRSRSARSATRGLGGVGDRAAQFLLRHDLVGHGLDHVGAGDEHVAAVLHHEDEVGHRRANRPPRPRTAP